MNNQLVLNNPPFIPADDQVIYMEWQYNGSINAFIRRHYKWLKDLFRSHGLHFCYLPLLGKEVIRYNAPHLTDEECDKILASLPSMLDCVKRDDTITGPVLAFVVNDKDSLTPGVFNLHCIDIETKWYKPTKSIFKQLVEEILSLRLVLKRSVASEPSVRYGDSDNRYSLRADTDDFEEQDSSILFSTHPVIDDEYIDEQTELLIQEIKERINALRNYGVNTMFLHDIIDENEPLSRMVITKDYRILLPDYNNIEIKIAALPKAVFLLFLRHPEGIRFKDLSDYYDELLNIYRALNPIGGSKRQQQSIMKLINPLSNSISEKCAKIREAFISKFDERLAQNYYITGKQGEPKRIALDKKMVVWE